MAALPLARLPDTFVTARPWYDMTEFQLAVIGFCLLTFLSACVIWLLDAFAGWVWKRPKLTPGERWARRLARIVSVLNLVFVVGSLDALISSPGTYANGMPPLFVVLFIVPVLTACLSFALLIFTLFAWQNRYWSTLGRLHYSLVTVAAVGFVWFLSYWDLLGLRF